MIKKVSMVFMVYFLGSCASIDGHKRPEAFLVVDGKQYEMTAGTSCWGDICSDSFGYTTEINPVYINKNSELKIQFRSTSKLTEAYIESIGTEYFKKNL